MNPAACNMYPEYNTGVHARSGEQYACSFDVAPNAGETTAMTDHWLISPRLSGEAQTISFYAGMPTTYYGAEDVEILYSTTDNNPESFVLLDQTQVLNTIQGTDWGEAFTFDLPEGATFFAIRHTSEDKLCLFVDDVAFNAGAGLPVLYRIYRDGELLGTTDGNVNAFLVNDNDGHEHTYAVTAVYDDGQESEPVFLTVGIPTAIAKLMAEGTPFDIYTTDGVLVKRNAHNFSGLKTGTYVVAGIKVAVK